MDVTKLPTGSTKTNPNHLQCSQCGFLSRSHSSLLIHTGNKHPCHLDDVPVGRLGNIVFYQSLAKLFHCHVCFFTAKDFAKVYDHIIVSHCLLKAAEEELVGKEKGRGDEANGAKESDSKADQEGDAVGSGSLKPKRPTVDGGDRGEANGPAKDVENPQQTNRDAEAPETGPGVDAIVRLVSLNGNRYVCQLCGWKTKMRGFCVRHVVASHNVAKPYSCKHCPQTFVLSTMLQLHMTQRHSSGAYRCPFCFFRTEKLRGLRCHSAKCRAKEEGDGEGSGGEEQ